MVSYVVIQLILIKLLEPGLLFLQIVSTQSIGLSLVVVVGVDAPVQLRLGEGVSRTLVSYLTDLDLIFGGL